MYCILLLIRIYSLGESYGCGGTIRLNHSSSTSSQTLKAPRLPTKTNLDCGWLILVEPSYVVKVQVISYTETPKCPLNTTNCRCSSIQVTCIIIRGRGFESHFRYKKHNDTRCINSQHTSLYIQKNIFINKITYDDTMFSQKHHMDFLETTK